MSHYEERLEQDIVDIRGRVEQIGSRVQKSLADAVHALVTANHELASSIILGDLPINRMVRNCDRRCHAFVARHLPSAGHLRFVSSVLRLNIGLERIGDYAVTIARESVQLSGPPNRTIVRDVELFYDHAARMLRQALKSFLEENAELARGTKAMSGAMDATFRLLFDELLKQGEERTTPLKDLFALLLIFNRLDRVIDQAKNICEDTLFSVAGETKAPKVYRVLFLDETNSSLSKMAEIYARKAFPDSGEYESRGWRAAAKLEPRFAIFMEQNGFDLGDAKPTLLEPIYEEIATFHIVVGLQPGAREKLGELPYQTTYVEWDLGERPDDYDQDRAEALLEESYKRLAVKVRELMEVLRGDGAG